MRRNFLIYILILGFTLFAITSCGSKKQSEDAAGKSPSKTLVLYYSQTGATKAVAEQLQAYLGADIEAIEAVEPYSGTYDETIQRCIKESGESSVPQIQPLKSDIARYDTIFVGYPVWFGSYARPIIGLLEKCDFEGKTIVPFCTFGSGGIEATTSQLREALPKCHVAEGYGVRNARIAAAPEELKYFLIANGYMAGNVDPLPEYSEQQPVTEAETEIFNRACGDYQFPLGTPVSVGKRTTATGTDYKYTVNSTDASGNVTEATIYVTVSDEEAPVFTRVVR